LSQPSIFPFGIRIDEPMIAATDLLVAFVCFAAYFKLTKLNRHGRVFLLVRFYFLFLGLATFWGGIVTHAFLYALNENWKVPGWLVGMIAVTMLTMAAIYHSKGSIGKKWTNFLSTIIAIELITVVVITIISVNFRWTGFHSVFCLAGVVAPLFVLDYRKHKDKGSLIILYGIGIFTLSGIVFAVKVSIHQWFNHVDLTHVILSFAVWTIFRGVSRLRALTK
jgi:hypothetical protein